MSRNGIRSQATGDIRAYLDAVANDPCTFCGAPSKDLDHITARSRGGGTCWTNLTAVCGRCNSRKRTASLLGFLGWLTYEPEREIAAVLLAGSQAWRRVGI